MTNHSSGLVPVLRRNTVTKTPRVIGEIEAGLLSSVAVIPRRDARTKKGYQREVQGPRVNRLANDLKKGAVDLPTAILVNIRDFEPNKHLANTDNQLFLRVTGGEDRMYIVDGQHRVEAVRKLVEEDPERWGSFTIPFVAMLGATEDDEMKEFYVVNSTAKSVRTDLAYALLKERAEREPGLMEHLTERGETWKVKAQGLAEEMDKLPVWRGRIRFPGTPSADTTIGSAGLVNSLKHLLSTPFFSALGTAKQVSILDSYWNGIRKAVPEAFDVPTDYAIQKATGVMVLHDLLVTVIEYLRSTGSTLLEPEPYAEAMQDALLELEGDTRMGTLARGSDFWRAGEEGAAGSYSSNAGRRVLTAKLRSRLPEMEVE